MPAVSSHCGRMLLICDVGTLEPLMHTWVALTIALLRRTIIYPMTFEYVFPALVDVLAEGLSKPFLIPSRSNRQLTK
jgi:hypothetical protein